MKVVRYDSKKKAEILAEALVILLSGGSVVYPTETAYALGADFFSPHAYRNIYSVKLRTGTKNLPVIVPDSRYASTIVRFSPKTSRLAAQYWPGPLTLVLPFLYRSEWPHHSDDFLALRVSSHPIASNLSRAFGKPLSSTSANISKKNPCYNSNDVIAQFKKSKKQPDLIIDAGELPHVSPSTIIKDDPDGLRLIRKGPIKVHHV